MVCLEMRKTPFELSNLLSTLLFHLIERFENHLSNFTYTHNID